MQETARLVYLQRKKLNGKRNRSFKLGALNQVIEAETNP